MKVVFTLLFSLAATGFAFAQTPMQTTVEYNGQKYPGYVTEYNLPPKEVQEVIVAKLKAEGYNYSKSKGFLVYRDVKLNDLDPLEGQDIVFKIERKSRKEKDKSLMTMVTAKAGMIPKDKVKGAKMVAEIESSPHAISFINSFQSDMDMKAFDLAVAGQEEIVGKAEKKLKSLQDDQSKLEKKIKDYQADLDANKNDQEKQQKEIDKQKQILDQKRSEKPGGS